MMHQLLKPLLLRFDFDELLKLRVGARPLAIHIVSKWSKRRQFSKSYHSGADLHVNVWTTGSRK